MVAASLSFGDIELLQSKVIQNSLVDTVCIDGYKFALVISNAGSSIVQIYEVRGGTEPARPIEC